MLCLNDAIHCSLYYIIAITCMLFCMSINFVPRPSQLSVCNIEKLGGPGDEAEKGALSRRGCHMDGRDLQSHQNYMCYCTCPMLAIHQDNALETKIGI